MYRSYGVRASRPSASRLLARRACAGATEPPRRRPCAVVHLPLPLYVYRTEGSTRGTPHGTMRRPPSRRSAGGPSAPRGVPHGRASRPDLTRHGRSSHLSSHLCDATTVRTYMYYTVCTPEDKDTRRRPPLRLTHHTEIIIHARTGAHAADTPPPKPAASQGSLHLAGCHRNPAPLRPQHE